MVFSHHLISIGTDNAGRVDTLFHEIILEFLGFANLFSSSAQSFQLFFRSILRSNQCCPSANGHVVAQLFEGRNIRIDCAAGVSHNSKNLQVACVYLALEYRRVSQSCIDVLACQSCSNVSGSFRIRYMLELYAEFLFKGKCGNMPDSADTGVTHFHLAGVCLSEGYEFIYIIIRSILRHNQSCRSCNRSADSCIILIGVFAFALMREHSQLNGNHTQSMTIGFSVSQLYHAGYTAAIGFVYGNKFAALQLFFHELNQASGRDIGTAARSLRNNYGNISVCRISCFFAVAAATGKHNSHGQHSHQHN